MDTRFSQKRNVGARGYYQLKLLAGASVVFLSLNSAGFAQVIDEIVVTAAKREQSLQDVPMSVSALGEDQIDRLGVGGGYREWADFVPGITISESSLGSRAGPNAVVRGVSNSAFTQLDVASATATTATLFGDVPVFSVDTGLFDMNRVEVLRGPQGTLYGAAALGGLIKYIPNSANTESFEALVKVGGGMIERGGQQADLNAMVNVPLVDGILALRASAFHRESDGWIDFRRVSLSELAADRAAFQADAGEFVTDPRLAAKTQLEKDANSSASDGMRIGAVYTPNDRLRIEPMILWNKTTQDHKALEDLQDPIEHYTERYMNEPFEAEYKLGSLNVSYDLLDGMELVYSGGYYDHELHETSDATELAIIFKGLAPDGTVPSPFPLTFDSNTKQSTHELRFEGAGLGLGPFEVDYTAGYFFQDERRDSVFLLANTDWNSRADTANNGQIFTPGGTLLGGYGFTDFQQHALFGNVTFHITDRLYIGGGGRYYDMKKHDYRRDFGDSAVDSILGADNGPDNLTNPTEPPNLDKTFTNTGWTPQVTVGFEVNDDNLIYATASKGFRVGGNNLGDFDPDEVTAFPQCRDLILELGLDTAINNGFESDSVWSYEVGVKSESLDGRLQVNGSVFFIDWAGIQQEVQLSQIDPTCLAIIKANAGDAESKGFELETVFSPVDGLVLNSAVSYTHARISKEFPGVPIFVGDSLARVPEWTAAVGAEYSWELPFRNDYSAFVRADWRYVSERIATVGDPETVNPFFIAPTYDSTNVRLGVDGDVWSGVVFVQNLFDQEIVFDATSGFLQGFVYEGSVGQPRTIGMEISRRF